jgi:hypothetical protein
MLSDPRSIDCAGYGAIYALHGILLSSLEILVAFVVNGQQVDVRPFLAIADEMIETIYSLPLGEKWRDARVQFLLLAHRYRDLIQALAIPDPEVFRSAAVELSEAQTVAAIALQRLAERLDLLPERVQSA